MSPMMSSGCPLQVYRRRSFSSLNLFLAAAAAWEWSGPGRICGPFRPRFGKDVPESSGKTECLRSQVCSLPRPSSVNRLEWPSASRCRRGARSIAAADWDHRGFGFGPPGLGARCTDEGPCALVPVTEAGCANGRWSRWRKQTTNPYGPCRYRLCIVRGASYEFRPPERLAGYAGSGEDPKVAPPECTNVRLRRREGWPAARYANCPSALPVQPAHRTRRKTPGECP